MIGRSTLTRRDVRLTDGRAVVAYDTGAGGTSLTLLCHLGSPHTGAPFEPLLDAAAPRGIRVVSYARPGYGGSTPNPGRTIGSAAGEVEQIVDALGIERFAVVGYSGGGPHALACAALLPGRVTVALTFASPAPFTDEFDWFAGMAAPGALTAARDGRDARVRFAATDEFDPNQFVAADWAALEGSLKSVGQDAVQAENAGGDGLIDDDTALAKSWGFGIADVTAPILLVHGGADRAIPVSHGEWLVRHLPAAELWLRPRDGHVSVLTALAVGMDWLLDLAGSRR